MVEKENKRKEEGGKERKEKGGKRMGRE